MTLTAIVIDDTASVVRVFADLLESRGVNVVGTGFNGKEAVELYKKQQPDFVFLDVMMPEYDGFYALKEIRQINPQANVVMVTADLRSETADKIDELKACAIVYKPFDIDEIMKIIEKNAPKP